MVEYMNNTTNAREMLLNQAKVFQRGIEGTPKVQVTTANIAGIPGPAQWKPLWDVVDDQEPVTLPRAYVIPVGDDQRSASDASRLVQQLLFHDIEVDRLTADTHRRRRRPTPPAPTWSTCTSRCAASPTRCSTSVRTSR